MRKIIVYFISTIVFMVSNGFGEVGSIRLSLGYQFYSLSDLKDMQNSTVDLFKSIGIELEATDQFPANFYGEILIEFKVGKKSRMGFFYEGATTGGRLHYLDYSGEIKIDQILYRQSFGIISEFIPYRKYQSIRFSMRTFVILSTLKNKELMRINDQSVSQTLSFNTISFGVEPGFSYVYSISEYMIIGYVGYQFKISTISSQNEKYQELFLLNTQSGISLEPDWSGLKIGLSVGYEF